MDFSRSENMYLVQDRRCVGTGLFWGTQAALSISIALPADGTIRECRKVNCIPPAHANGRVKVNPLVLGAILMIWCLLGILPCGMALQALHRCAYPPNCRWVCAVANYHLAFHSSLVKDTITLLSPSPSSLRYTNSSLFKVGSGPSSSTNNQAANSIAVVPRFSTMKTL